MAERIVEKLRSPVASDTNTGPAATRATEDQKMNSSSVTFSGDNDSGFQLGENTGIISGFTFGRSSY